jgi:hypothetical protein
MASCAAEVVRGQAMWQRVYGAIYQEGDLCQFWLRNRAQQKHHLAVVTTVAGKLCHVISRIMTGERDYLPDGRSSPSWRSSLVREQNKESFHFHLESPQPFFPMSSSVQRMVFRL